MPGGFETAESLRCSPASVPPALPARQSEPR